MGYPPSICNRTPRYARKAQHYSAGPAHRRLLWFRWLIEKETEGERFVHLPCLGGVLEEILHIQFDNARVWSTSLAVHHTEGVGVVVPRDVFGGIVHRVRQRERRQ